MNHQTLYCVHKNEEDLTSISESLKSFLPLPNVILALLEVL